MKTQVFFICSLILHAHSIDFDDYGSGLVLLDNLNFNVSNTTNTPNEYTSPRDSFDDYGSGNVLIEHISSSELGATNILPTSTSSTNTTHSHKQPTSQKVITPSLQTTSSYKLLSSSTPSIDTYQKNLTTTKTTTQFQSLTLNLVSKFTKQAHKNQTLKAPITHLLTTLGLFTTLVNLNTSTPKEFLKSTTLLAPPKISTLTSSSTVSRTTNFTNSKSKRQTTEETFEAITLNVTESKHVTLPKYLDKPLNVKPKKNSIITLRKNWIYPLIGVISVFVLLIIMSSIHCYLRRFNEYFE
uniref:Glycoprotein n=1 Tax=Saimiriine herpesvirus 2 TaxID=10381 RepID=Q805L2_SHV2|nr:glycoprotein [Saimiriine gammaherpesvirus 2]CAC85022.1 glycoprotein [Saimiriine gammaherpesvirus 2]CAC85028.1 glycoprotein [Saimiriine gammaherpesvirus 2]CAC85034.1 glycoprotein [Saimiriine gammaherpesvirus 2]CAC85040.1 glycoprotein [Saimiriine gammaherpesvirus 2]